MKILHELAKDKIVKLKDERDDIIIVEGLMPFNSFSYTKCALALAIVNLKIELWRAVCH